MTVLDREPGAFLFAEWMDFTIFVWTAPATPVAVARLTQATEPIYKECSASGRRISNVHLISSGLRPPEGEARDQLIALMKQRAEQRACIAVIVDGMGFWASALRSFVTGIRFVSTRAFPLGIHGNIDEAMQWLPATHETKTGTPVDREGLRRAITNAREQAFDAAAQKLRA
jgi:hypothetical protein